jgi:hypothetical protein
MLTPVLTADPRRIVHVSVASLPRRQAVYTPGGGSGRSNSTTVHSRRADGLLSRNTTGGADRERERLIVLARHVFLPPVISP